MLQWNELRITPDGKYLIIDVEVQNLDYYENVYINTLSLQIYSNLDTSHTIYIWRDSTVPAITDENYREVGDEGVQYKRLRKVVDIDSIGDCLFYVTATNTDDFAEDTPCGVKQTILHGAVYNKYLLYTQSIKALRAVSNCTPSKDVINYILQFKMFELALETGDKDTAITYWNKCVRGKLPVVTSNCGCYGQ
jgi:hypothetical protein